MANQGITDDQIAGLAPSLFTPGEHRPDMDEDVRAQFLRIYKPLRDEDMNDYNLSRIASGLYYYRPLLARVLHPTRTKNALEIGSGTGLKSLCWADLFRSYVGIELSAEAATNSGALLQRFGFTNARIITGNAEAVLRCPEKHGLEQIDLLILYAVVEHLTIPERKAILQLAQEVYLRGGDVLIAEAPNRLCRLDQHSWQMSFVEWLPPELLNEYALKSKRGDLTSQLLAAAPEQRHETLYRLGRGMSFHEFECFWDEKTLASMNVIHDGYSPDLLNLYPFVGDELDLLTYCANNDVNVHRMFTRYWIDGIISQRAKKTSRKEVTYLGPRQIATLPVTERRRFYELDEVTLGSGASDVLTVESLSASEHEVVLLLDIARSSGTLLVEETRRGLLGARGGRPREIPLAKYARGRLPAWHTKVAMPLGPSLNKRFRIKMSAGGRLSCHGVLLV